MSEIILRIDRWKGLSSILCSVFEHLRSRGDPGRPSSSLKKLMLLPKLPARPVRPMRWMATGGGVRRKEYTDLDT